MKSGQKKKKLKSRCKCFPGSYWQLVNVFINTEGNLEKKKNEIKYQIQHYKQQKWNCLPIYKHTKDPENWRAQFVDSG